MQTSEKLSCVIIGGGTLPIRCAEILLDRGNEICAVISSDAVVKRWASEKKIVCLEPSADLSEQLREQPFDYLFSIVNEHILRPDILQLPRKLAINYHDAPLPNYAGTHATSWALLNGERLHGISWHVITEVVDAGDILKQQRFEVAEDDTALALNTKCYEAAIDSFGQLVEELSVGNVSGITQDLEKRTFFPRYKRPANGCVISWNNGAADISALVRALHLGPYPNPLGSAKLALRDDFVIIPALEVLNTESENASGTICEIGPDFLRISTEDREVVLRNVLTLNGDAVSIPALVEKFGLHEGYRFTDLDSETAERLESLYVTSCKHESFWVKRLATLEPAAVPYGVDGASFDRARYASLTMRIPDEVFTFLEVQKPELSARDLLLAAYGALLARLGGVDSFDVGYMDSELRSEIDGLESAFATHPPLRLNVDCAQSFTELLQSVRGQVESCRKHKTYALDLVTRYPQLSTGRESGYTFTLPVSVESVKRLANCETLTDSTITLVISETDVECLWIYDQARIKDESVDKLARHFTTLLKGIAADPEDRVAYSPLLNGKEQNQLLVEWNNTHADYPKDKCVHQLVAARAKEFPEAVAVLCGDQSMSYGELNARSNQLGNYLRRLGVGLESVVAICMERSVESVIGQLGILKAGGAYLPLDPAYPAERLSFMLEDAGVSAVLAQQRLRLILPPHQPNVLCLDKDWAAVMGESTEDFHSGVTARNLAYVIYTSGSSGRPKGVEVEHSGLVNLVTWHQPAYCLTPADRATLLAGPAFDASVWELWPYLASGASIYIPDDETRSSASRLVEWLARQSITICFLPTPLAEAALDERMPSDLALRVLLTGGDRLHQAPVKSLPFRLVNHYGPTENTVVATCGLVERKAQDENAPSIGCPIANAQVYLLDRCLQPVPVGISGEIYIGGDGLARGYRNRADLTAERFIPNSFSDEPGERLYKTGDLARYLPDGNIEFIGRLDNQVKIRGFRIEPGEIEAALNSHARIKDSVVVASEEVAGNRRLIAYLVAREEQVPDADELRGFLKEKLPELMVPAAFFILDELPVTPNGKVDRHALRLLESSERRGKEFVAPRSVAEEMVAEIWSGVLGVSRIGVFDNFFELGGHSLKATQVMSRVRSSFQVELPLRTLFEADNVAALAAVLENCLIKELEEMNESKAAQLM